MNKNNFLKYSFNSLLGGALLIWGITILWASNKGFDITDEGFYHYYYSMPANTKIFYTSFHLIQNLLFPFVNCTIQNLRIERLILSLSCALFFAYSSSYFLRNSSIAATNQKPSISLYFLIITGVFLSYAFGPQSPSYNTFSYLFIITSSSLFLFDLSKKQKNRFVTLIYITIGVMCGLLFLDKFPNAILLPLVFIFFYFTYNIVTPVNKLRLFSGTLFRLLLIIIGYLMFHIFYWKGIQPMIQFHKDFISYLRELKGYDNSTLLKIYSNSFTTVYESLVTIKFTLIIITLIGILWSIIKKHHTLFYLFLLGQLLIIVKFKMYYGGEVNKTEQTIVYFLWVLTLLCIFFIQNIMSKTMKTEYFKKRLLFSLFLLFMPIVGCLGTNNALHIQIIFYMPFWMLLIYLLIENNFNTNFSRPIYILITLLALSQSADAVVNHPYRINSSLFSQDQKLSVGKNDTVLVDLKYKENISTIYSLLVKSDYKKDDYLFTFTDAIGLAYIFNNPIATNGSCWFNHDNDNANCKTLQQFHSSANDARIFFILDKRQPPSEFFKKCLSQIGYDFDNNYYKVGEVFVDFSNDPHYLSIYAPL